MTTHYYEHALSIYMQGLAGIKPGLPMTLAEMEAEARAKLDPRAYWYVAGGAGMGDTVDENRRAFQRWRIVPYMCRDVSNRDWSTRVMGTNLRAPIMLAPVGVQEIVHPEAELAVARAASASGVPIILSTLSSKPLEAVSEAMGNTPRWFQLYPPGDMAFAKSLIERAENAGYSALVITVDTRQIGWRVKDLAEAYLPFLQGQGISNYCSDPVFRGGLDETPEDNMQGAVARWAEVYADAAQTWDDFARMRDMTRLPVAIKGVLHPDDARRAVELGFDGIVVSNHGGRQVDGSIAALDALPKIVEAVNGKLDVMLDSGIRGGADMVKALALGAKAVLIGRPFVWGLAVAGENGVRHVLQILLGEFDGTCALSGLSKISDIDADILERAPA